MLLFVEGYVIRREILLDEILPYVFYQIIELI